MLYALAAICLTLLALLWRERCMHRNEFARLEDAIRQGDREMLGSAEYAKAPEHIRTLERAIFDQLFATASLEESVIRREKLLAALVEGLGDAVLVTDKSNRIRLANERAREVFDLPGDVAGARLRKVITNRELLAGIDVSHSDAQPTASIIELSSGRTAAGASVFEVDIAPLQRNTTGGADVSRIVLHDISERQKLERVRKDFVANASHELRTPLTIINGYLETLLDGAMEDRATIKRFLGVMQKHGVRLARLVEDMLTISKLESDDQDAIKFEDFNFRVCASEVVDRLSPVIETKQARVELDIPPGQEILHGDRIHWDQVLFNLVENALKENDQSGLVVTISKQGFADGTRIIVEDDGVGIPAESLPFIFKRFYRVDESHAQEKTGTGLGLSIVKRAIEAHGGTIEATSTPGVATAFTIDLPEKVTPTVD